MTPPDRMKCPHCKTTVKVRWSRVARLNDPQWDTLAVQVATCPTCTKALVVMEGWKAADGKVTRADLVTLYPKITPPRPVPAEVAADLAQDFREAADVSPVSPRASAALSRLLLQHILREKAEVRHPALAAEIEEVLDQDVLLEDLARDLEIVRAYGSDETHPIRSGATGEVVPVRPGEAEYLLTAIEGLLAFYFVR